MTDREHSDVADGRRRARATLAAFDEALRALMAAAPDVPRADGETPPAARETLERELATLRSIARTLESHAKATQRDVSDWSERRGHLAATGWTERLAEADRRLSLAEVSAREVTEELSSVRDAIARVGALLQSITPQPQDG